MLLVSLTLKIVWACIVSGAFIQYSSINEHLRRLFQVLFIHYFDTLTAKQLKPMIHQWRGTNKGHSNECLGGACRTDIYLLQDESLTLPHKLNFSTNVMFIIFQLSIFQLPIPPLLSTTSHPALHPSALQPSITFSLSATVTKNILPS